MENTECFDKLLNFAATNTSDVPFTPTARYKQDMDFVLYLNRDCSYRADRVDSFLTVLWHPQKDQLVGVKLKGFKFIFSQLSKILDLGENDFVPLVKALEVALVGGFAEQIMQDHERERSIKLYDQARELTKDVQFKIEPSLMMAA